MEETLPELKLFCIRTAYKTHKWEMMGDGLIEQDGEMMTPGEMLHRFTSDQSNPKVLRSDVCERLAIPNGIYSYTWVEQLRLI